MWVKYLYTEKGTTNCSCKLFEMKVLSQWGQPLGRKMFALYLLNSFVDQFTQAGEGKIIACSFFPKSK